MYSPWSNKCRWYKCRDTELTVYGWVAAMIRTASEHCRTESASIAHVFAQDRPWIVRTDIPVVDQSLEDPPTSIPLKIFTVYCFRPGCCSLGVSRVSYQYWFQPCTVHTAAYHGHLVVLASIKNVDDTQAVLCIALVSRGA